MTVGRVSSFDRPKLSSFDRSKIPVLNFGQQSPKGILTLLAKMWYNIRICMSNERITMPTVMNVNEAKSNFSGLLSFVHNDRTVVTIMRYGHPIAQIVPCPPKRKLRKDPVLSKIKINCNLFEDESSDWEAMND